MYTKVGLILRIVLVIFLFAVPIALAMIIWFTPALEAYSSIVALSAVNVPLGIAEVMFLTRAAIFPKNGKAWWKEW